MKQPAIKLEIRGIKCDNDKCDYRDDLAEFEDYKSYINKPCPECGENLLTQADYDLVTKSAAVAGLINDIMGPVEGEYIGFEIGMNGSGKIQHIKRVEDEE